MVIAALQEVDEEEEGNSQKSSQKLFKQKRNKLMIAHV